MTTPGAAAPFAELAVTATAARGVLCRTHARALCRGHFPGDPFLPGAYVAGLMADVAAALLRAHGPTRALAEVVRCTFHRPLRPDATIEIRAAGPLPVPAGVTVDAEVRADGRLAARARLRFA